MCHALLSALCHLFSPVFPFANPRLAPSGLYSVLDDRFCSLIGACESDVGVLPLVHVAVRLPLQACGIRDNPEKPAEDPDD